MGIGILSLYSFVSWLTAVDILVNAIDFISCPACADIAVMTLKFQNLTLPKFIIFLKG